jgi:Putative adhesin
VKMATDRTAVERFIVLCALALTVGFTASARAEDYIKSYQIVGRAHVQVRAANATVHITTSDNPKVTFDVTYDEQYWSDRKLPIDSRQNGDSVALSVIPEPHDGWDWNWFGWGHAGKQQISIEVRMPKNADLQLQTSNGAVDVASLNGDIGIHTSNGQIRAEQLSGTMDIGSSNGPVILETLTGTLQVHTSNGAIWARGVDGRCELDTSNGRIQVAGRFDSLNIHSSNGAVIARAESGSTMASGWTITTSNSGVDLTVPSGLKANLDASTSNGGIAVDLPVTVQGFQSRSRFAGTLNGGGPELSIHTSNGSMSVRGI